MELDGSSNREVRAVESPEVHGIDPIQLPDLPQGLPLLDGMVHRVGVGATPIYITTYA